MKSCFNTIPKRAEPSPLFIPHRPTSSLNFKKQRRQKRGICVIDFRNRFTLPRITISQIKFLKSSARASRFHRKMRLQLTSWISLVCVYFRQPPSSPRTASWNHFNLNSFNNKPFPVTSTPQPSEWHPQPPRNLKLSPRATIPQTSKESTMSGSSVLRTRCTRIKMGTDSRRCMKRAVIVGEWSISSVERSRLMQSIATVRLARCCTVRSFLSTSTLPHHLHL